MPPLNDDEVASEMKKMTEFIKQEANEKAREIQVKADEEHNIEKAKLVRAETLHLNELYERKMKQAAVQKKIQNSTQANKMRLRVLELYESTLNDLFTETRSRMATEAKKSYDELLMKLLLQGLLQLLPVAEDSKEPVSIICRKCDVQMVQSCLPQVTSQYSQMVKGSSKPQVSVDHERTIPDSNPGGIVQSTLQGKVVCQNTLEARLDLATERMLPYIRMKIFGPAPSRRFFD